jgi:hypothetical protein
MGVGTDGEDIGEGLPEQPPASLCAKLIHMLSFQLFPWIMALFGSNGGASISDREKQVMEAVEFAINMVGRKDSVEELLRNPELKRSLRNWLTWADPIRFRKDNIVVWILGARISSKIEPPIFRYYIKWSMKLSIIRTLRHPHDCVDASCLLTAFPSFIFASGEPKVPGVNLPSMEPF